MPPTHAPTEGRAAQGTGDWVIPARGPGGRQQARERPDRPQEDRWAGAGHTVVPRQVEIPNDRPWQTGIRAGLFINRITLECSPIRVAQAGCRI